MFPIIRFGPFGSLLFSRKVAALATAMSLAIVLGSFGCMGLDSASQNGTQSSEGNVSIPPNSTVEVVFPYPFASPPTLTIYAWHGDWKIVEQNEKSFKISNKNGGKSRSVDWKARGVRVMQLPAKAETRVISTPLTETGSHNDRPAKSAEQPYADQATPPAIIGPPR